MLFCSGQLGVDPRTQLLVQDGVEAQTRCALENLSAVIGVAGFRMGDVVRTTIYLVDMKDFEKVNRIYAQFFPNDPPARATVAVAALPRGGAVEIDAIAVKG
jgi:2-iminobutanoate/2-iminopropanoate deaminase